MTKKKVGSGSSKNDNLRGGKNSLPKKADGTVDVKKVVKEGAQEQKKKWVDKKVVKDRTTPKQVASNLKKVIAAKPQPTKGVSKLKAVAKVTPTQKSSTPQKSTTKVIGISKLKIAIPIKPVSPKKAPVRRAPIKGR